jgi:hypothetical protein
MEDSNDVLSSGREAKPADDLTFTDMDDDYYRKPNNAKNRGYLNNQNCY